MNKYVEVPRNKKDADAENRWYQECIRRQIPYITVTTRTKLANVHWDYIAFEKAVDQILIDNKKSITDGILEIYHRYALPRSECMVSAKLADLKNLPVEDARQAAEELYDLVSRVAASGSPKPGRAGAC